MRDDQMTDEDRMKRIQAEIIQRDQDLRDHFAGIALGAMIGSTDKDGNTRGKKAVPVLAMYAYEYADAMMKARKQ